MDENVVSYLNRWVVSKVVVQCVQDVVACGTKGVRGRGRRRIIDEKLDVLGRDMEVRGEVLVHGVCVWNTASESRYLGGGVIGVDTDDNSPKV